MTDDAVTPSFPVPAVIPTNGAPRSRLLSRILGPKQQFLTPGQLRDRISEIEARLPALCEAATPANYAALDGSGSEAVAEECQQRVDRAEAELRRCRSALPAAEKRLAEQQAEDHAKLREAAAKHREQTARRIREAAKALHRANMGVDVTEQNFECAKRRRDKASGELKSLIPEVLRDRLGLSNGKIPDVTPSAIEELVHAFLTGELPRPPRNELAEGQQKQYVEDMVWARYSDDLKAAGGRFTWEDKERVVANVWEQHLAREEEQAAADAANLRKILEELGLAAVTGESPS